VFINQELKSPNQFEIDQVYMNPLEMKANIINVQCDAEKNKNPFKSSAEHTQSNG
jgi:hypothetical protein